jgi:hypothetical protein
MGSKLEANEVFVTDARTDADLVVVLVDAAKGFDGETRGLIAKLAAKFKTKEAYAANTLKKVAGDNFQADLDALTPSHTRVWASGWGGAAAAGGGCAA